MKRNSNAPLISGDLLKLCRRKKALYKRAKKDLSLTDWDKYRKFNNYVKKECNSARRQFVNNLADELKTSNSPKPFLNFVQSKRKVKCDLVSLEVNDSFLNDDLSIANCMNSYFSSVFTVDDPENFPDLEFITDKKLCNIFCSATEVEKLLRNLNIYKSPGPDYISPRILRECAQVSSSQSTDFISEYIILSRSTTMYMEVGPHHSSSQEREQKANGELPPNITDLMYCMQDCRICGKDPSG